MHICSDQNGSIRDGIRLTWLPCLLRLMGSIDWRRYCDDEDRYVVAVLKDDTFVKKDISNLSSVFSKGQCYNLYTNRRKEIFFTPAAEYIHYSFWYEIFSNVMYLNFVQQLATHMKSFNKKIFQIYSMCLQLVTSACCTTKL